MMKRNTPPARPAGLMLACALLCASLGNPVAGRGTAPQSPAPPAIPRQDVPKQDDDDEVVRITSNLVQFDVTVTDKKGNQVTDLKPEDFEVIVDGRPRSVTEFSYVSTGEGTLTRQPGADPGGGAAATAPPVPPSRLRPEQVRRTIALVADDLGLSFESTFYVRQALKKFVDEQMQPGDLVAVMRTSAGMGALQQFTSDKRLLHRAIERVKWTPRGRAGVSAFAAIESDPLAEARERAAAGGRDRAEARRDAEDDDPGGDADEFREDIFAVGTLGALNFIVRGLRELPGRKSVVMFSDGFSIYRRDGNNDRVRESLRRLVDLATRASVVVNTVDARGLVVTGLTAADDTSGLSPRGIEEAVFDRGQRLFDTQGGLHYLADATGGLFVRNSNDLPGGVRRVLEAQRGFYLVGFRPDDSLFDQTRGRVRFNRVEIRVRRDGLRVRTRGGFYGFTEDEARPVPRTRREQIGAALVSPFAAGAVPLRLTSLFKSASPKDNGVVSLLHIDMGGFKFADEADGWKKAVLDVVALTFGEDGQVIDEVNRVETVRARAEAYQHLLRRGLVYTMAVPVKKPGAYQLRVVVRDAATEKIGTASQLIEVPDLKKGRLALSGIVLSGAAGGAAPADAAAPGPGGAAADTGARDEETFVSGPAVRRYRRGATFEYYYDIYNARTDKATGRQRLTTQTRLFRDNRPVFTGAAQPYDPGRQADMRRLRAGTRLALSKAMPPGEYLLQVVVTDGLAKGKHRVATQWIDFEVVN